MEQETKTTNTDTNASRRQILKAVSGALVTGLSAKDRGQHRDTFATKNTSRNTYNERKHDTSIMKDTPAYLTDPGFSLLSLLANLPNLLEPVEGSTPVILMDTHDYERLQERTLTEEENDKIQHLGMAYEELRRRDILDLIDYTRFYPPALQQDILSQNQTLIEKIPDQIHQEAAVAGIEGLEKYGWGEYQQSFRSGHGEEGAEFTSDRKAVKHQRTKIDRGGGDPIEWNRNVLNEYMTALKIRHRANNALNYKIHGVIGQGDTELLSKLLNTSSWQQGAGDIADKKGLDAEFMNRFDHNAAVQKRETLDRVGEIAAKVADVQHEDWTFLGSTLAFPKFDNFDHIQSKIRGRDEEALIEEAHEALEIIRRRRGDDDFRKQARYEADYEIEQRNLPRCQHQEFTKELTYAAELANHMPEIRDLGEGDDLSRPAFFVAASVVSDPTQRYEKDDLQRRARDVMKQIGPSSVTKNRLETYQQRGGYLRGEASDTAPDWFEDTDRTR